MIASGLRTVPCITDLSRGRSDRSICNPRYGGQYSAAGAHGGCPERYRGRAYINNQQWDITALGDCSPGANCPVSPTLTDEQFNVPMGCTSMTMTAQKMRGRGTVTTETPSAGNGWRGALHIADWDESACNNCGGNCAAGCQGFDDSMSQFGGAAVYDVQVRLSCASGGGSAPQVPVRLSCVHNYGTGSCHMVRLISPGLLRARLLTTELSVFREESRSTTATRSMSTPPARAPGVRHTMLRSAHTA